MESSRKRQFKNELYDQFARLTKALGSGRRLELIESQAIILPFLEDDLPAQAGLGAFENQELEQEPVSMHRHAPFLVVILDVQIVLRPGTAVHWRFHEFS